MAVDIIKFNEEFVCPLVDMTDGFYGMGICVEDCPSFNKPSADGGHCLCSASGKMLVCDPSESCRPWVHMLLVNNESFGKEMVLLRVESVVHKRSKETAETRAIKAMGDERRALIEVEGLKVRVAKAAKKTEEYQDKAKEAWVQLKAAKGAPARNKKLVARVERLEEKNERLMATAKETAAAIKVSKGRSAEVEQMKAKVTKMVDHSMMMRVERDAVRRSLALLKALALVINEDRDKLIAMLSRLSVLTTVTGDQSEFVEAATLLADLNGRSSGEAAARASILESVGEHIEFKDDAAVIRRVLQ